MRLTDTQMLAHWRRHRGLESLRSDCSVELFDGVDAGEVLRMEMRAWYLDLLDNAPLRFLSTTDIASRLSFAPASAGVWRASLPPDVRRLVAITVKGADAPVPVLAAGSDPRRESLNANPFSRSGPRHPSAFSHPDRTVTLCCASATMPEIVACSAIVDPGDETYQFDESALGLLYNTTTPFNF